MTLGREGPELHRRGGVEWSGSPRSRRRAEFVLSPRLYLCAGGDNLWPDPDSGRLVARLRGGTCVTSQAVLAAVSALSGESGPATLIPAQAVFSGAGPRERDLLTGLEDGQLASPNSTDRSVRRLNQSHRRHQFRPLPNRPRRVRLAGAVILCLVSAVGFVATMEPARDARAQVTVSANLLASAQERLAAVNRLQREAETLEEATAGLDQFALVPPASLVGAIVSSLPPTVTAARLQVGRENFVVELRGEDLLQPVQALSALAMITDVTVQSRSEADGSVSGEIRGRIGP
jgi:type II secretory pathway component PulM